ncbi:GntR family transcriptional regulator [Caballeronia sordidicola]|uniref:Putative regulator PutR for proline utilization, GntR family n=1 Tax=Caballeronia sordidicola TaxID=196367 RepID=A0A242MS59_CABSO|nr:GntR family transcriptional regulator [Caballeronia sordidicola]OTP74114.1 putative regulator PutR for proline utilization, GntR family [Caballeronia sordidicola]
MERLSLLAQVVQDRRQSASAVVADALREAIFRRVFKQGEPLRQDAIAKQFMVSQVTVREALRLLGDEGLVEIVPRRGAIVACLTADDVREIVELRMTLESMLIAAAIPRLSLADLEEADRVITRLDKAKDLEEQLQLNLSFHSHIYSRAERPRTVAMLEKLRLALEPYLRMLWLKSEYKSDSQADHRQIIALCRAKNTRAAQKALASHISHTGEAIVALLQS